MDRRAALAYLDSLTRFGIRLGLERMAALMEALGHPERRLRVVHVAGTNGKGSTCALLEAVLRAAGYRTGLYTSPHLVRYEERIRLNGRPIPGRRLAEALARVRAAAARLPEPPTEFEAGTAAMYLYFAAEGAEVVVQETGLGGRLDATNVVPAPLACVLTPIALDHTDRLGATVAAVAAEKAGVIKPGVPVVSAPQPPAAAAAVAAAAARAGAPLVRVGREVAVRGVAASPEGTRFRYRGLDGRVRAVRLGLLGPHQAVNAACALAAVEVLARRGLPVPEEAVDRGLARARWRGRLEVLSREPLLLVDGAHNPHGAAALRRALVRLWPGRRFVFVLGVLADKDAPALVSALAPVAAAVVATRPDSERALAPAALARLAAVRGLPAVVEEDPLRAVRLALAVADGGGVCVAGSLYLVGRVLAGARRLRPGAADGQPRSGAAGSPGAGVSAGAPEGGASGGREAGRSQYG